MNLQPALHTDLKGDLAMPADNRQNNRISTTKTDPEMIVPDVSFLDGLSSSTLELVELIMATSMGRKDIIDQFKKSASL